MNEFHGNGYWKRRVGGIRANASLKSHAELDESTVLDTGDKCLLASGYARLFTLVPSIKVKFIHKMLRVRAIHHVMFRVMICFGIHFPHRLF